MIAIRYIGTVLNCLLICSLHASSRSHKVTYKRFQEVIVPSLNQRAPAGECDSKGERKILPCLLVSCNLCVVSSKNKSKRYICPNASNLQKSTDSSATFGIFRDLRDPQQIETCSYDDTRQVLPGRRCDDFVKNGIVRSKGSDSLPMSLQGKKKMIECKFLEFALIDRTTYSAHQDVLDGNTKASADSFLGVGEYSQSVNQLPSPGWFTSFPPAYNAPSSISSTAHSGYVLNSNSKSNYAENYQSNAGYVYNDVDRGHFQDQAGQRTAHEIVHVLPQEEIIRTVPSYPQVQYGLESKQDSREQTVAGNVLPEHPQYVHNEDHQVVYTQQQVAPVVQRMEFVTTRPVMVQHQSAPVIMRNDIGGGHGLVNIGGGASTTTTTTTSSMNQRMQGMRGYSGNEGYYANGGSLTRSDDGNSSNYVFYAMVLVIFISLVIFLYFRSNPVPVPVDGVRKLKKAKPTGD